MVEFIYMVPEIMNSNDRPNPTSWFWFNQWPNRSHLYTPGKPKAHISWLCEQNWNSKSRLGFLRSQSQIACDSQNWKLWKINQLNQMTLVWWKTTQIRQFNENKIFLQREFVQFRKINFFPANLKSVWLSGITDQALFGVKTEHPSYDVFILLLSISRLWKWLSFRSL